MSYFLNYYYFEMIITLTYECFELISLMKLIFDILFIQDMDIESQIEERYTHIYIFNQDM